jgi:hypothetical protein
MIVTHLPSPVPVPDALAAEVHAVGIAVDAEGVAAVLLFLGPPDNPHYGKFALSGRNARYLRDALDLCLEEAKLAEDNAC